MNINFNPGLAVGCKMSAISDVRKVFGEDRHDINHDGQVTVLQFCDPNDPKSCVSMKHLDKVFAKKIYQFKGKVRLVSVNIG